ncbi:MAG: CIA30 family protein [Gemmataceae bacterium]
MDQTLYRYCPHTLFVPWQPADDGLMGGVSHSAFVRTADGHAAFRGVVSLENNGGFCSVRSPDLPARLTGGDAIALRVRGDGRTYTLCLHTRTLLPGTSYRCRFTPPAGEWVREVLPFAEFVLMRFGQRAGVSPVDPAAVTALSLLVSDRQEGPFTLEVAEVTLTVSPARPR